MMKKTYKKPCVIIEDFTLSEHIAGCSLEYANGMKVSVEDLKFAHYFTQEEECQKSLTDGSEFIYNGTQLCYHTSASTQVVFSS